VNVALATMLSAAWRTQTVPNDEKSARGLRKWAWFAFGAVYLQLIVGAAMRHLGAGLAITTFPEASPDGSWLPAVHNTFVDLNFMHTRVGAVLVTCLVLVAAGYAMRRMYEFPEIKRPAWTLIGLVLIQCALGMFVIWHLKPRTLTTFHVLNGAALLAVTLLLALRASNAVRSTRGLQPVTSL
jgi:cytochrome c oxidase assembly protein subunit 15